MKKDSKTKEDPTEANKKDKDSFSDTVFIGAGILVATLFCLSVFLPNISDGVKFFTVNLLSLLVLVVIYVQTYIYRRQWEVMDRQVQIMSMAIDPRLRVASVRAVDLDVGGLPVFIVSLVNEGATEARDVEIKLMLQKGDDDPAVFWTRQQTVTIPANGREDYPVRWPSILRRQDFDGFNNNVPLRV